MLRTVLSTEEGPPPRAGQRREHGAQPERAEWREPPPPHQLYLLSVSGPSGESSRRAARAVLGALPLLGEGGPTFTAISVRASHLRHAKVRATLQAEGLGRLPALRLPGHARPLQGYQAISDWVAGQLSAGGNAPWAGPEGPPRPGARPRAALTDEEEASEALDSFMQDEIRVGGRSDFEEGAVDLE